MIREFWCRECGELACTHEGPLSTDLDGRPQRCESCGIPGHYTVDYDEEGADVDWRPDKR